MKKYLNYKNKISAFEKIKSCELSEKEKDSILDDFEAHLEKPYGTLENYPKKYLLEALEEKYSGTVNMQEIKTHTRMKINGLLEKIWNLVEDNQELTFNLQFFKYSSTMLRDSKLNPHRSVPK